MTAGCKVLALCYDALVVIDIVLPAMFGLVLVRESSVEPYEIKVNGYVYRLGWGCKYQLQRELAIRPFPARASSGRASILPVTNLKGLVSRSPSDIFAVSVWVIEVSGEWTVLVQLGKSD